MRHSKRHAMYNETKTMKAMSARMAFSVIERPHDELTELTETSLASVFEAAAKSSLTLSCISGV